MPKTSETTKKRTTTRAKRPSTSADAKAAQASDVVVPQEAAPAPKTAKRKAPTRATAKASARTAAVGVDAAAVAHRAYIRFVERGYAHGHDLEDWIVAERELAANTGARATS